MKLLLIFLVYAIVLSIVLRIRGFRRGPAATPRAPAGLPSRVLIVGATGGTGRELVAQALERGHVVTALVRNPSSLSIVHPRLRIVRGNVLDAATVAAAVREHDAVVSALGHKQFFRPTRILSDGTRNIVRAMEEHHVGRFVCETSLGIGDSAGRMGLYYTFFVTPIILPFYFLDKARQERVIAASRVEWVIVRPGVLTNAAKRGRYRHGKVGSFVGTVRISRADVADFMLNQMTDGTYVGAAPGVCG
jgi:putative NADH-flavin reductase